MTQQALTRHPCPLCGGRRAVHFLTAFDRAVARAEDYRYIRCPDCGLIALDPPPTPADLASLYPAEYHDDIAPPEKDFARPVNRWAVRNLYGVESATRPAFARALARAASRWIMPDLLEPHGGNRLLDIGCGTGALLRAERRLGWTVRGIETDPRAGAHCRADGLDVHVGTVFDAPFGPDHDVVLMSHVIEHVPDPVAVLARAAHFLAPAGRLLVVTPNARGLGLVLYRSCWYGLQAPRHLFVFDPRTLRLLGARAGLVARRIAARPSAWVLADSRRYAATQGQTLPPGIERRRALVQRAADRGRADRLFRDLISPVAAVAALLGRSDIVAVEYVPPAG